MNSKLEEKTLWACHNKEIVLPLYVELTMKGESKVAKPIKETPILFGEDARKFEARMKEKNVERHRNKSNQIETLQSRNERFQRLISMILTEEIFQETYIVRRLKMKESVKSFDCGDTDLNDFILNESLLYRKALLAVSYVVEDKKDNNRVAAYFSLANDRISLTDFKDKTEFNHFRKHRFVK